MRELNARDPNWREKLRIRKQEEVKRMELEKEKLQRELQERQIALAEEEEIDEHLKKIQKENWDAQKTINDIDRKRKELQLQQEINSRQRELE